MANKMNLLIKSTIIVLLTIVKTSTAGILPPNELTTNIEESQNENEDHSNYLVRNERAAKYSPNDYYANYYNDYYNNYYNRPVNGYYKPSQSQIGSADRFDGNNRDDSDNDIVPSSQGVKYVYVPIFQYKSTQQKRHKLFVPNLFG